LAGALKIALVIELVDRRVGRVAVGEVVGELKRADPRLDPLRSVLACCRRTPLRLHFLGVAWVRYGGDREHSERSRGGAGQQRDRVSTIGFHRISPITEQRS